MKEKDLADLLGALTDYELLFKELLPNLDPAAQARVKETVRAEYFPC